MRKPILIVGRSGQLAYELRRSLISFCPITAAEYLRQIWAFCAPVIPLRVPALRRRRLRFFDDMPSLTPSRYALPAEL